MRVLRRIGHVGGGEGRLSGLALRATATVPGMSEQAAPGAGPVDAGGGGTADHLGLVEVVQGREDGETWNQRSRKMGKGLQEGRLAPGPVVPIISVQGEQDASGTDMLGEVDREGQYRKIALRQWNVAHPLGFTGEMATQSREIHGLKRCVTGLGETLGG